MMGIGIDLDIPEAPLLISQPPLRDDELRAALLDYASDLIPGMRCGSGLGNSEPSFTLGDGATAGTHALRVTGTEWSLGAMVTGPGQCILNHLHRKSRDGSRGIAT
jgi:hypothetical protein